MYCPQCGVETKPGAKFCHACGQSLETLSQSSIEIQTPAPAEVTPSPMTATAEKRGHDHHPWRRFFARTVDLFFFVLLGVGLISIFPSQAESIVGAISNPIIASVVVYFLWIPIEAAFLAKIGATPAKWIFGIRVSKSDGRNLSYSDALKRTLFACIYGDGFGIPIFALFTRAFAYGKLNKTGTTKWDTVAGSVVEHSEWGLGRAIGATMVVAVVMLGSSFLLTIGNMQAAKPVAKAGQVRSEKTQSSQSQDSPEKKPVVDREKMRELEVAANQGDAVAQYELGKMYFKEKNREEAARWIRLSADQGYVVAQDHMGNLYYIGYGVTKDTTEAVRLFRLAAKQGFADSNYSLGRAYGEGQGVPQDDKLSRFHFGLALDQGNTDAALELAWSYSHPLTPFHLATDVERKGNVVGYALYNLKCSQGCDKGSIQLRDRIKDQLDDKHIKISQALTREMVQGKPTEVIARYLKTGSAGK